MRIQFLFLSLILFISSLSFNSAYASCGSAYCVVNTQGMMNQVGSQFDMRYEYIHQDQLMSDDSKAKAEGVLGEHDETDTYNRNLQLTYSYLNHDGWGLSINAPIVSRDHYHVHNDVGGPEPESWHFTELGDVRILSQFQLSVPDNHSINYGVIGGVKLATGRIQIENNRGEEAERTLQPGTGTTDIIAGAFYRQVLPDSRSSIFAQVLAQTAVNTRDHFKPGEHFGIDVGYRYAATERLGLNIQANYLMKWRDEGTQAEAAESGLRALFVSPGINYALTPRTEIYSYVQLPVYQNVNGTQLTADSALTAGVSTHF